MHLYTDANRESPIFTGGTGRSGTSILGDFIGAHPSILRLPYEIRIFTDRGGLLDLKSALSRNFSQQAARASVRDFISFTDALTCAYTAPYLGYDVDMRMQTNLKQARQKLLDEILLGTFRGWDKELHDRVSIIQVPARIARRVAERSLAAVLGPSWSTKRPTWKTFLSHESLPIPKYYPATEPLVEAMRDFIGSLFGPMMDTNGSGRWCDATPANLACLEELAEIYPDAKFVHVVRHPLGVAQSMMERQWMPNRAELVAKFLYQSYARISDQINRAGDKCSVITIKIEELSTEQAQSGLSEFLGVDFGGYNKNLIQSSLPTGWRERVSKKDADIFEGILKPFIKKYDYTG